MRPGRTPQSAVSPGTARQGSDRAAAGVTGAADGPAEVRFSNESTPVD